ncbi:MAG TPA: hypothetical protein VKU01_07400 [Bryobacteraceae bacterium]|nr:hypothetical protein [Bryobacteraceae bacterium]
MRFLLIANLLLFPLAGSAATSGQPVDAAAAFDRLKALVGSWEAPIKDGKMTVTYELMAGGTAVVEKDSMNMVTVYYLDGDRLLLTHYCMAGNQPRMQARKFDSQTGELDFQFLDATNLKSPSAGHMHNARIRFVDGEHFNAAWQFYEKGEPKFAEDFQFTRVR